MSSETAELEQFFDTLWGDTEGWVYVPTCEPADRVNGWKKYFFEWPKKKEIVVGHVLASSAKGLDVYSAPAIFKKPNPHKEHVLGSNVLWTEFDGNAPEHWSPETENGSEDAAPVVPAPSLRVQSSRDGHEHVYWRLDEFSTDIDFIENTNRSIAYTVKSDTSGWDINQILRPPGSTNFKHNLPVTVAVANDRSFTTNAFAQLKPAVVLVNESIDLGDLPAVDTVIAKYPWDAEHFELFKKPHIDEGQRSSALMRVGFFCAEAGMSDEEAYAILDNADARWGKFVGRNDRKKRLLDIINKARQKHPVALEALTFRGLTDDGEVETDSQYLYGFKDFLESEIKVEWLIENLLEVGGFGMVAAKPGVGKTQYSLQLGIACALGTQFLRWTIPRRLKVLFLSLEMSRVALKHFLDSISTAYDEKQQQLLNENLKIVPLGEAVPLQRPEGLKFLELLLNETNPDLIIVDSFNKISNGKFTDEVVNELNQILIRVRNKFKCGMWIIHHNRKENGDNKKPTSLDDVYGSVFITAEQTSVQILWAEKKLPDRVEVITVKNRLAEMMPDFVVERDNKTLQFSIQDSVSVPEIIDDREVKNVATQSGILDMG